MSIVKWIQKKWHKACSESIGTPLFWGLSVDNLMAYNSLSPLISKYSRGKVLDAGAGRVAWKAILSKNTDNYFSSDVTFHPSLNVIYDLHNSPPFKDSAFDTVFCCSVLEHMQNPWEVLDNMFRIIKSNGHLILSVPFLYHLHGSPHDYFRFTHYGIEYLAKRSGFEVIEYQASGGIFHSIANSLSICTTALLWTKRFPFFANQVVKIMYHISNLFNKLDKGKVFAQNYNFILRRT